MVLSDINVLQPDILFISRDRFGYQATGTFVSPSRLESPLLPGLNIDLERIFGCVLHFPPEGAVHLRGQRPVGHQVDVHARLPSRDGLPQDGAPDVALAGLPSSLPSHLPDHQPRHGIKMPPVGGQERHPQFHGRGSYDCVSKIHCITLLSLRTY